MKALANFSLRRSIGTLVVVLGVLTGGTLLTVKITTDHLLYRRSDGDGS